MSDKPSVGSRWKHTRRGSVAVVLCVDEDEIIFQFPKARNNPARGTGRFSLTRFLEAFTPMPEAKDPPGLLRVRDVGDRCVITLTGVHREEKT